MTQFFEKAVEVITKATAAVNDVVWGWPMIVILLGTGILLTFRMKFFQLRKFRTSFNETLIPVLKGLGKKQEKNLKPGQVSQFEAFSAAISGTVGTGNIVGVTSAILTGGPGAVFWMWLSAFFGMVTNYSENVLGLYFRKRNEKGEYSGGAFYYIYYGIKQKWLGYLAAVFCLLAAVGMSGVQTNKIAGTLSQAFNYGDSLYAKLIIGIVVAAFTALIIIGGIKRIGSVASKLVPFMSLIFMVFSLIAIGMNITAVPEAFRLIFGSIFGFKAMAGGFGGYAFSVVIKKGMARGIFSNEAGLGSSVIAHSASDTKEPVRQGLWGIFEVFFDTFVICTLTALVLLTTYIKTGALSSFSDATPDAATAMAAFGQNFGVAGIVAYSVILPLFAFTTILAWSYYGEKACQFCFQKSGEKGQKIASMAFKCVYVVMIVAAALIESDLIWAMDDAFNGLMALPNLIALVCLNGLIVKLTKNYFGRQKGKDLEPMLSAYPELNARLIEELKAEKAKENA